jgi:hypothetical protein
MQRLPCAVHRLARIERTATLQIRGDPSRDHLCSGQPLQSESGRRLHSPHGDMGSARCGDWRCSGKVRSTTPPRDAITTDNHRQDGVVRLRNEVLPRRTGGDRAAERPVPPWAGVAAGAQPLPSASRQCRRRATDAASGTRRCAPPCSIRPAGMASRRDPALTFLNQRHGPRQTIACRTPCPPAPGAALLPRGAGARCRSGRRRRIVPIAMCRPVWRPQMPRSIAPTAFAGETIHRSSAGRLASVLGLSAAAPARGQAMPVSRSAILGPPRRRWPPPGKVR